MIPCMDRVLTRIAHDRTHLQWTSCYIHVMPMATLYAIRWFPEDTAAAWHTRFEVEAGPAVEAAFGSSSQVAIGAVLTLSTLFIFTIQQSLEMILVNLISKKPWFTSEFVTLFRYSSNKGSGIIYKGINAFGPKFRGFMVRYRCRVSL